MIPAYPVNLDLAGRPVLVVGGGTVAARKIDELVRCGATVTVVSPHSCEDVHRAAAAGTISLDERPYRAGEAAGYRLVITATDRREVNQAVHDDAEAAGVWVNAADDPQRCTFTLPARHRVGPVTVAVSTGGASPALASWLCRRLANEVGPEFADLAEILAGRRRAIHDAGGSTEDLAWDAVIEVVHDGLVDRRVLELARPDAECIDVAKRPGSPTAQDLINALLVHLGSKGLDVVRLKGGDPFVFGRGGEEAQALAAAGIAFDVTPGVSAALAAPAAAGVPVTHRGLAACVTVVTGHRRPGDEDGTDWAALARTGGTLVILMGVAQRAVIAARLMAGGLDGSTPVAVTMAATTGAQRTLRTTLAGLGDAVVSAPATIVVGAVAGLDLGGLPLADGSSTGRPGHPAR